MILTLVMCQVYDLDNEFGNGFDDEEYLRGSGLSDAMLLGYDDEEEFYGFNDEETYTGTLFFLQVLSAGMVAVLTMMGLLTLVILNLITGIQ